MASKTPSEALTGELSGAQISHVLVDSNTKTSVHLLDGRYLVLNAAQGALTATVAAPLLASGSLQLPTKRQLDYLRYIAKYHRHAGRADWRTAFVCGAGQRCLTHEGRPCVASLGATEPVGLGLEGHSD